MWVLVLFDLPTTNREERKIASDFRGKLLKDGFCMFQYSIYTRFCPSRENADVHIRRVKKALPKNGHVAVIRITDKQFGLIEIFQGQKNIEPEKSVTQLQLF